MLNKVNLVNLLVGLLMLVQLSQAGLHLRHLDAKQLNEKLTAKSVEPSKVFTYLDMVTHKSEVKIGETDVKQLINLNDIQVTTCLGESFAERQTICKDAESAKLANIDSYCKDRLGKLAQLCAENADIIVSSYLLSEDRDTIDFLRALIKEHLHEGNPDYKSIIDERIGYNSLAADKSQSTNKGRTASQKLRLHCGKITTDLNEIENVLTYSKEHGASPVKIGPNADGWTRVYELCRYFLDNYKQEESK